MGAVFAQGDCNKDNWREYYNSEGRDMTDCDLEGANLERANLTNAILEGVRSSRIRGKPASLPKGWSLVDGRLIKKDGEQRKWNASGSNKDSKMNIKPIAVGLLFGVGMALALKSWLLGIMFGIIFYVAINKTEKTKLIK